MEGISVECLPISVYCKIFNDTTDAIRKRIERQFWHEGVQVLKIEGSKERWIDLIEVNKWARQNKISSPVEL
ncbi:excisionase [Providencia alcalifaciens]|nr:MULTISPECIES: excisionase [Providencia]PYZ61165.1 excisionase [Providencia rettgeri]TXM50202.1 excisionase [Providencia rettgeri]TXM73644.1 excisionase [Providencia rettgeri]